MKRYASTFCILPPNEQYAWLISCHVTWVREGSVCLMKAALRQRDWDSSEFLRPHSKQKDKIQAIEFGEFKQRELLLYGFQQLCSYRGLCINLPTGLEGALFWPTWIHCLDSVWLEDSRIALFPQIKEQVFLEAKTLCSYTLLRFLSVTYSDQDSTATDSLQEASWTRTPSSQIVVEINKAWSRLPEKFCQWFTFNEISVMQPASFSGKVYHPSLLHCDSKISLNNTRDSCHRPADHGIDTSAENVDAWIDAENERSQINLKRTWTSFWC